MVNQAQVKQWIDTHVGKRIDFDGAYGAQCMDLSVQYAHDLWGFRLTGNAENLRRQALPAGWQRIQNSRGFVPQLGDIFVWYDAAHPYGHTGIVTGTGSLLNYSVIDQNTAGTNGGAGSEAKRHTYSYAHFWGVVRPPIAAGGNVAPTPPPSTGGKLTAQRGTFKANSAVNIRRAPNTKTGTVAGVLKAGQTVNYDNIIDADGWRWVSWVGASGNRNYSAVRRLSDNFRTGLCY